jgi:hypothetical protein
MNKFRILVTGSRDWPYAWLIENVLSRGIDRVLSGHLSGVSAKRDIVIVHGDCPIGADAMAEQWAQKNGVPTEKHPADWNTHGSRAGFRRNSEMVMLGADMCLAFIYNGSRGALDCAGTAEVAGIHVIRFRVDMSLPEQPE